MAPTTPDRHRSAPVGSAGRGLLEYGDLESSRSVQAGVERSPRGASGRGDLLGGFTTTDLNGNTGTHTVEHSAQIIVRMALLLNPDGPTGGYYDAEGQLPW